MNPSEFARLLRNEATVEERCLWDRLRNRQVERCRFRRQVALGRYVVDFVCLERRVIVEVDGAFHGQQRDKDDARTAWLQSQGFEVLRYWNNEVLDELEHVIEGIANALRKATPRDRPTRPRQPRGRIDES